MAFADGAPLHALQRRAHPPDAPGHPAMEAGVSDHVWEIEEIVGLLDWAAAQAPAGRRFKLTHYPLPVIPVS